MRLKISGGRLLDSRGIDAKKGPQDPDGEREVVRRA
jgi:hypothetical protein